MSVGERACTYACLILHDDGIAINAEKITKLLRAANVSVELYWPGLFAKLCEKKNLDELIMNIAAAGGGGATDEKEWTIGLPKSLPWDTNAEDSSSEGSEDEESKQESMLLKHTPRTIFTREAKEAMKLHQQRCTEWYRMRMNMVNISLPLPPPPPFIPVPRYTPAPLSSTAGYMSPEEEKKQLAEFLEKHPKSSGHDQVTSYLKKKLQKSISLMDQ